MREGEDKKIKIGRSRGTGLGEAGEKRRQVCDGRRGRVEPGKKKGKKNSERGGRLQF